LAARRIHAAGHLQRRQPRQARVHDRSAADRSAGAPEARPAGGREQGVSGRRGAGGAPAMSAGEHAVTGERRNGERAIAVEGLTKSFGDKRVVDDIAIDVRRGRVFGFLGPNGSGKTTTIRMLCGLLTPDAGTGTCLGYDIRTEQAAIKRRVGYMTQKFSLYEDLSIRENLEFIARVYGMGRRAERVDAALEQLGLV